MPETISKDKQYRTRDGREVRVYATDGSTGWPVHGAFKNHAGDWVMGTWTATGSVFGNCTHNVDLIEVKPRFRIERWVNVYPEEVVSPKYMNRAAAIRCRGTECLATKRIIIEGTEGEDDSE